jgi:hypothetical protein
MRHEQLRLIPSVVFANIRTAAATVSIRSHDELRLAAITGIAVQPAAILSGDHRRDLSADRAFHGDSGPRLDGCRLLHGRNRGGALVRSRLRYCGRDDSEGEKSAEDDLDDGIGFHVGIFRGIDLRRFMRRDNLIRHP